jgi:hypothetical protein
MSTYKNLVVNELFGENANDVEYENYCLEVNDALLEFIRRVDASRKKMLKDSSNMSATCSYFHRRKSFSREESMSLSIQDDIKRDLKYLKICLDQLNNQKT